MKSAIKISLELTKTLELYNMSFDNKDLDLEQLNIVLSNLQNSLSNMSNNIIDTSLELEDLKSENKTLETENFKLKMEIESLKSKPKVTEQLNMQLDTIQNNNVSGEFVKVQLVDMNDKLDITITDDNLISQIKDDNFISENILIKDYCLENYFKCYLDDNILSIMRVIDDKLVFKTTVSQYYIDNIDHFESNCFTDIFNELGYQLDINILEMNVNKEIVESNLNKPLVSQIDISKVASGSISEHNNVNNTIISPTNTNKISEDKQMQLLENINTVKEFRTFVEDNGVDYKSFLKDFGVKRLSAKKLDSAKEFYINKYGGIDSEDMSENVTPNLPQEDNTKECLKDGNLLVDFTIRNGYGSGYNSEIELYRDKFDNIYEIEDYLYSNDVLGDIIDVSIELKMINSDNYITVAKYKDYNYSFNDIDEVLITESLPLVGHDRSYEIYMEDIDKDLYNNLDEFLDEIWPHYETDIDISINNRECLESILSGNQPLESKDSNQIEFNGETYNSDSELYNSVVNNDSDTIKDSL
jgi:regulator of replication initiation timing